MPVTAITGSASGIGAALSEVLMSAGHTVIGIDRANAEINADLSTPSGRQAAVASVLERCGGVLDGLVCCAGVGVTAPSCGLIVAVNHFGVNDLLDGLFEALQKGHKPAAVVVGSVASVQPGAHELPMVKAMLSGDETRAIELAESQNEPHMAYAGSKYSVTCMARQKAPDWGKLGVRLNVVAPGAVETPLLQASKADPRYGESTRRFVAPLGRGSEPTEVASVIAFLLSEQASFVHGSVLFADGGMDAMVRPNTF
ncbi:MULTISPECIES: SDR family oxidoreductase [Pseudomonadaceae]|uniref:SDR family oxidoreductase n=1 Tax=Pseudomonadaceae TaxID=135621 RepID=UPI00103F4552|nr:MULTISPECIES: SDR family oxidoreductase [Pseudomonadaceae]MBA1277518.1 SDR family oxidoreductase [Stutzerimonas stutzeri]MBC8651937.1 SDR family oxidoreductase [Pseudomonas sp. MT4]QXY91262.1 SDR family oxidoreductase [Pseudomonas sp. MTM4]TCD21305.1 SDR family oxidoreductase [Pseudomonas sp. IC_126]